MTAGLRARIGWLSLFAVGFGFVEAAVVVYLRRIYYPDGFAFPILAPLFDPADPLTFTELAREAATLLMLLGVAGLAARTAWGRFGAFALAFGIWDLVFYLGLRAVLGWPQSLATWDLLFLVPGIWTGPVWSAAGVAVLLVVCGGMIMAQEARGRVPRIRPGHWALAALSLGLLLTAFLWNHGPVSRKEMPGGFPWPVWLLGVVVGLATFADLTRRTRSDASDPTNRSL